MKLDHHSKQIYQDFYLLKLMNSLGVQCTYLGPGNFDSKQSLLPLYGFPFQPSQTQVKSNFKSHFCHILQSSKLKIVFKNELFV